MDERKRKSQLGVSLIEVLAAVFVLGTVTVAVTGLATLTTRTAIESERQAVGLGLANRQIEVARSLQYSDVGVVGGDPPGLLKTTEEVVQNEQTYTRETTVAHVNDPLTPGTEDFKSVKVSVSWRAVSGLVRDVSLVTYISPAGAATGPGPGPSSSSSSSTTSSSSSSSSSTSGTTTGTSTAEGTTTGTSTAEGTTTGTSTAEGTTTGTSTAEGTTTGTSTAEGTTTGTSTAEGSTTTGPGNATATADGSCPGCVWACGNAKWVFCSGGTGGGEEPGICKICISCGYIPQYINPPACQDVLCRCQTDGTDCQNLAGGSSCAL